MSYAREFLGEKAAYVAGWMYFFNWACTSIVDVTAIALYMHYWGAFEAIPQWTIALIALVIVLTVNMISVKWFGEMEFWAALIKVVALVTFLVVGIVFLAGRFTVEGQPTGVSVIADNGGILPDRDMQLVIITSGVIFAYAAVELVGTAAGETENPAKVMPKAINSVVFRIAVFYVGSLILLALLLPYTAYKQGTSPFVTFFSSIGVPAAGDIMNFVVLTAALSSLNAGLYSTGRILRSMSMNGSAPQFTVEDDETWCAVCRYRAHRMLHRGRRLPEPGGAVRGVQHRARPVGAGHHRVVGHHRDLPDPAVPLVEEGHSAAPVVPVVRHAVHELRDAGLPVRGHRTDVLRELLEPDRTARDRARH